MHMMDFFSIDTYIRFYRILNNDIIKHEIIIICDKFSSCWVGVFLMGKSSKIILLGAIVFLWGIESFMGFLIGSLIMALGIWVNSGFARSDREISQAIILGIVLFYYLQDIHIPGGQCTILE